MHRPHDVARAECIVFHSYGSPRRNIECGGPCESRCQPTAALLAQALDLSEAHWQIGFQSRFGLARWLQPTTAALLERIGTAKTRRVDVFRPGFTADCLETLEELDIRARAVFRRAGGGAYHRIACVNDSAPLIDALAALAAQHLRR